MNTLKIAIQKSGRLNEDSLRLLRSCGIAVDNGTDQLKVTTPNFPLEIFYLRNSDIPQYLEDGVVDVGIIGKNLLVESGSNVRVVERLGFARCRLSLAIPKSAVGSEVTYFEGRKIATSYPNTTSAYLRSKNVVAEIHEISGSVEIAPNIGLADGICDLVSSGSTLFKNNLKEIETVATSEAVLACAPIITETAKEILDKLLFRIKAVQRAKNSKYILLNVPNEKIAAVSSILPVLRSPTVLPLSEPGWSSLHSVIDEQKFWDVIDELKRAGAEDILIVPIDKMVL
ncbi:ATP phosphoribosyltransferase [Phaeocystidibacter marisrubri]|uniref:ATP phosphoribosyltransferase n=1 Tax=Phaeocystidibacter marisrubri TaxID=1577780 RepID=A0A6L3ZD14_9FLAO|nr:ATP phosphoribosyltransferase [Phaeocystidibacter marisrubri]KAB2815745.1 ATP phosphoribosyltransferase [Phaeocystidibacter marisrubri]GGH65494.1 ATP phosphoribosyltransferase [Phaeocystidibacter marisrubri]